MIKRRQAEMTSQGLADIGEAVARSERRRKHTWPKREHGHVFARMIAARPCRIAAMVRSDHRQVSRAQQGLETGQRQVEGFKCRSVAFDVAAVAVERIEIDEICQRKERIFSAAGDL